MLFLWLVLVVVESLKDDHVVNINGGAYLETNYNADCVAGVPECKKDVPACGELPARHGSSFEENLLTAVPEAHLCTAETDTHSGFEHAVNSLDKEELYDGEAANSDEQESVVKRSKNTVNEPEALEPGIYKSSSDLKQKTDDDFTADPVSLPSASNDGSNSVKNLDSQSAGVPSQEAADCDHVASNKSALAPGLTGDYEPLSLDSKADTISSQAVSNDNSTFSQESVSNEDSTFSQESAGISMSKSIDRQVEGVPEAVECDHVASKDESTLARENTLDIPLESISSNISHHEILGDISSSIAASDGSTLVAERTKIPEPINTQVDEPGQAAAAWGSSQIASHNKSALAQEGTLESTEPIVEYPEMTKYTPVTEVSAVECVTPPCISAPIQEVQKSPVEILVVNLVPQANQTQPTPPSNPPTSEPPVPAPSGSAPSNVMVQQSVNLPNIQQSQLSPTYGRGCGARCGWWRPFSWFLNRVGV
ncbi:hypothetical protein DSO57_1025397 [Entomophthora muscae]|uniref:Uncharacterized protein n=1 Tax=Entomophthora muscae TaxID=34485 RepID=A0ACC2RT86_9FUNG|nr:hypothetical protein DSO57_1025397 [Entomophthora muscae]